MKISLTKALQIARDEGYDGAETVEAVSAFFAEKNIVLRSPDKSPVVITKGITLNISRNGNPADTIEVVDEGIDEEASIEDIEGEDYEDKVAKSAARKESARQAKAASGFYAASREPERKQSVLNSPEGIKRLSERKAYERKVNADKAIFNSADEMQGFSSWFRQMSAKKLGGLDYEGQAYDREVVSKSGFTIQNTPGGMTVPVTYNSELIKNWEEFGVAPDLIGISNMASMSEVRNSSAGWATVSAATENQPAPISTLNYGGVQLTAKEWTVFAAIPVSLVLTSQLDIENEVIEEFSRAWAEKLDQVVFSGDGTADSFGIAGFRSKLLTVDGTIGNIAGLQVASGNTYDEFELQDFVELQGRLPAYADKNAVWAMHKRAYNATAQRLALEAGGVSANEVHSTGVNGRQFLSSPVKFVQNMPSVAANSQIMSLYGDFKRAAKIGYVINSLAFDVSKEWGFRNRQVGYLMSQSVAVTIHDVGDTSEAGPVVGLITAAS